MSECERKKLKRASRLSCFEDQPFVARQVTRKFFTTKSGPWIHRAPLSLFPPPPSSRSSSHLSISPLRFVKVRPYSCYPRILLRPASTFYPHPHPRRPRFLCWYSHIQSDKNKLLSSRGEGVLGHPHPLNNEQEWDPPPAGGVGPRSAAGCARAAHSTFSSQLHPLLTGWTGWKLLCVLTFQRIAFLLL